jgi:hypothetical protein
MGYEDRKIMSKDVQAGDRLYLLAKDGTPQGPYEIVGVRPSRGNQFQLITMVIDGEEQTYGYATHEEVHVQVKDRTQAAPAEPEPHKAKGKVVHLDWSNTSSIRTACGRYLNSGEPAPWSEMDRVTCQRCRKSSLFKQATVAALTAARQNG